MNHSELCRKIAEYLKTLPRCWFVRPVQFGYSRRGVPDFIVCLDSNFLAIEVKVGRDKLSIMQDREMKDIFSAGGATVIARSLDDVKERLK